MAVEASNLVVRPLADTDIEAITRIDEKVGGAYRPDFWEDRVAYYLRRDPESSRVAEIAGVVVGFMLGDVRGGEFGLEERSGWIERFGVDPAHRGRGVGREMFDALAAHFRGLGAAKLRTFVDSSQAENAKFLAAVGFGPSRLTALEKPLS
ncbi:MAG: GNAT family N-acetyltransferase [Candidatus Eisenbacteria bacterium]